MTRLPAGADVLPQADHGAELPPGRGRAPAGLQVAELRGRDRHRHRAHLPQRLARRRPATTSPATRSATTTGCTTSATPTPARCCASRARDTLAPVGPGLVTDWDFRGKTHPHAGQRGGACRRTRTDEMEWDMHYLVADIARTITLSPGDLLFSGTPANSRPVEPGDVVEVEVEGLGRLSNHIVVGPDADPHRRGRPADRERGGRLDRPRRRLGVPRHPHAVQGPLPLHRHPQGVAA